MKADFQNPVYKEHCRDKENVDCCASIEMGSLMEVWGKDCVKAEGYKSNRKPEEKGGKNLEGIQDPGVHQSHRKGSRVKAKIRVQNKPPLPNAIEPIITIPEFIPKTPSQYRR